MDDYSSRIQLTIDTDVLELDIAPYLAPTVGRGSFPTVDEIQAELLRLAKSPDCRIRQIGNSPQGEPLRMMSVGHGPVDVLVIAGVHPNEPIGCHTVFALMRLVKDTPALSSAFTFHFIACLDADAALMNHWYAKPLTIESYHRRFYRPPLGWQPEPTFPIDGHFERPRPETWALMRLRDELDPQVVLPLHNNDIGGAFFVVNRRLPDGLADVLRSRVALTTASLNTANAEVYAWDTDGDGVFVVPGVESVIGHAAARPVARGARVHHYFDRATVIEPEVPLWQAAARVRPPGGYPDGLQHIATERAAATEFLAECLSGVDADLSVQTVFKAAALDTLAFARRSVSQLTQYDGPMTADLYAGQLSILHMGRLRTAGMLLRAFEAELAAGNVRPTIRTTAARVEQRFQLWVAECERALRPEPFPIEQSIEIQMQTVLVAAAQATGAVR